MAQSEYTFPQDFGTGSAYSGQSNDTGDNNDAARFGALVGATQLVSCIINGLTFSNVDFTNLTVDIDSGKFYAVADDIGVATANETRDDVAHVNGHTGTSGLSLTDSAVNHVYAYADLDVKDDVKIDINTTNTSPSHPSVKIGEIDTTNNTVSEQWNLIRADGTLSYPNVDAATTALQSLPTGVTVIDRDTGTQITDANLDIPSLDVDSISGSSLTDQITDTQLDTSSGFFDLGSNDLRIDTNQTIEDGSGTSRFSILSDRTEILTENGRLAFRARDNNDVNIFAYPSAPFEIRDVEGSFHAVKYETSASAPGTLDFINSIPQYRPDNRTTDKYSKVVDADASNVYGNMAANGNGAVGTSATTILRINDRLAGLVVVHGDENSGTSRFYDLLFVSFDRLNGTVDVISQDGLNADARTYSLTDSNQTLQLAMASSEYRVGAHAVTAKDFGG